MATIQGALISDSRFSQLFVDFRRLAFLHFCFAMFKKYFNDMQNETRSDSSLAMLLAHFILFGRTLEVAARASDTQAD